MVQRGVALQLDHDAFVESTQFAHHLGQVEALLPAKQAVSRRIALLSVLGLMALADTAGRQSSLEIFQQRWNVVVQLAARQRRARSQFGVGGNGLAPSLQDVPPSVRKV